MHLPWCLKLMYAIRKSPSGITSSRSQRSTRKKLNTQSIKDLMLIQPLFEFCGACAGCGEAPYLKLLSQLFGDRVTIANATGCSSIYGGNLPTTPWTTNRENRGPAWANSLFEDNAEFGFGLRLALNARNARAKQLLTELASEIGDRLVHDILNADQSTEEGIKISGQEWRSSRKH